MVHKLMCGAVLIFCLQGCQKAPQEIPTPSTVKTKDTHTKKEAPQDPASNYKVSKKDDNLFLGETKASSGAPIYLAFEKLDDSNLEFWRAYRELAHKVADELQRYPQRIETNSPKLAYPNALSNLLGLTQPEHDELIAFFRTNKKNKGSEYVNYFNKIFSGVKGGFAGMNLGESQGQGKRDFYVVYASDKPIETRYNNSDYHKTKTYRDNFGAIIMSMAGITAQGMPTVTHTGISKNPIDFVGDSKKYAGISMVLHGFGASVIRLPKRVVNLGIVTQKR